MIRTFYFLQFVFLQFVVRLKNRLVPVFLLISIALVSACMDRGISETNDAPTLELSESISPTPNLTVSRSETAGVGESQEEQYTRQILVNLGTTKADSCLSESRAEIWISEHPFKIIQPLLQDANIDYLYPSWSPNEAWFAYVSSNPLEVTDPTDIPEKTGVDSIWIMRPDGSNQRKISEDIPSLLIRSSLNNSCVEQSKIVIPPVWSQDGKHIIFAQATWDKNTLKRVYNYYAIDVESGRSQFLLSQDIGASPVWTVDAALISGEGFVNIIKGFDSNQLTIVEISYPTDIATESESFVSALGNDKDLTVSFRLGSTLISPIPKKISVWKLNSISEEWKQITIIDRHTWGIPRISKEWTTLCEENAITLLDSSSWEIIGQVTSEELGIDWINCGLLKFIRPDADNAFLAFALDSENKLEIDTLILRSDQHEIRTLIDLSTFSQVPLGTHILEFSLKAST